MEHKNLYKKNNILSLSTIKAARLKDENYKRQTKRNAIFTTNRNLMNFKEISIAEKCKETLTREQKLQRWKEIKAKQVENKKIIKPTFVTTVRSERIIKNFDKVPKEKVVTRKTDKNETKNTRKIIKQNDVKKIDEKNSNFTIKNSKIVKIKQTVIDKKNNLFHEFTTNGPLITSTARKKFKNKKCLETKIKSEDENDSLSGISSLYIEPNLKPNSIKNIDQLNTQKNQYLSPFVSTSRGKGSFKREQNSRETLYKITGEEKQSEQERKRKATAQYFYNVLNTEIHRLNGLWEMYKNEKNNKTYMNDIIETVVTQTRLFISKNFQQFHSLIVQYENKCTENVVHPEELEEFWTILYTKIENLNQTYESLLFLKNYLL